MTAPASFGRARRIALAAAGLTLAAVAAAPVASAEPAAAPGYPSVAPPQGTDVLPVKHGSTTAQSSTSTQVLGSVDSSSTLAYTGAEVGGVAAGGLALVVGGLVLVRAGRRRSVDAA